MIFMASLLLSYIFGILNIYVMSMVYLFLGLGAVTIIRMLILL